MAERSTGEEGAERRHDVARQAGSVVGHRGDGRRPDLEGVAWPASGTPVNRQTIHR